MSILYAKNPVVEMRGLGNLHNIGFFKKNLRTHIGQNSKNGKKNIDKMHRVGYTYVVSRN